jgi:hypothetical protein
VLVDEHGAILAGHGRVAAAKQLGWTKVPVIEIASMTEAQKRAYVIADNKLALKAGWDEDLLALELGELALLELEFDLTLTGFEMAEIDLLIGGGAEADPKADAVPEADPGPPVSRRGDLWLCGPHRVLCADATYPQSFATLLGSERAQLVFIDPPYNVPIDGHVCGLGAIRHAEFAMASGEMSEAEFTRFLQTVFGHLIAHSADGSIHFVCMDWRHISELLAAARELYVEQKNLCIWNKDNGGMGSLYRSKHELVFVFKAGLGPHINNVELGKHGRYRTNVWDYAGVNSLKAGRLEELALQPDGQARRPHRRCHSRLLQPRRARARLLPWQRHHPDRRREDRSPGGRDGARSGLCRHRAPPLAGRHGAGAGAWQDGPDLRRGSGGPFGRGGGREQR